MKKSFVLALGAIVLMGTACRKERTCECKTTETEVRIGFGEKTTVDISSSKTTKEKQKKNAFKYSQNCFSETSHYNSSGGNGATAWSSVTTDETTCELK